MNIRSSEAKQEILFFLTKTGDPFRGYLKNIQGHEELHINVAGRKDEDDNEQYWWHGNQFNPRQAPHQIFSLRYSPKAMIRSIQMLIRFF
jgi:hypothetical protein